MLLRGDEAHMTTKCGIAAVEATIGYVSAAGPVETHFNPLQPTDICSSSVAPGDLCSSQRSPVAFLHMLLNGEAALDINGGVAAAAKASQRR